MKVLNKKVIVIFCVLVIAIVFIILNNKEIDMYKELGYHQISQEEAKDIMDNEDVIILDVREQYEYDERHIDKSILVPLGEINDTIEDIIPNKESKVLVYCRTGNRSKQASANMVDLGYTNVYEFGGINTWTY